MRTFAAAVAVWSLLLCASADAAERVGDVEQARGSIELSGDAAAWRSVAAGEAVHLYDSLRTGADSGVAVALVDDSVLNVAADTQLRIDESMVDVGPGLLHSAFSMVRGQVRAFVAERYRGAGAEFSVRTRNAVMGVRGTDFIVRFDPATERTEVLTLGGSVEVRSSRRPSADPVLVLPDQLTVVLADQAPTPPRRVSGRERHLYLRGLEGPKPPPPPALAVKQLATNLLPPAAPATVSSLAVAPPSASAARPSRGAVSSRAALGPARSRPGLRRPRPIRTPSDVVAGPTNVLRRGGTIVAFPQLR